MNRLSLYANGVKLAAVDSDFASGDVGLIAGTYDIPGTEIHFDDLVVLDREQCSRMRIAIHKAVNGLRRTERRLQV